MAQAPNTFAVCIDNRRYRASLMVRRLYQVVPDRAAEKRGFLRVIDESGEDYLYPSKRFVVLELPRAVERRLATTRSH